MFLSKTYIGIVIKVHKNKIYVFFQYNIFSIRYKIIVLTLVERNKICLAYIIAFNSYGDLSVCEEYLWNKFKDIVGVDYYCAM